MMSRSVPRMILCLILLGCAEVRESGVESTFNVIDSPPGVSVYFDRDVQSIFSRSCTGGCHEPGGSGVEQAGLDLTGGSAYSELLDATRSRNGPQVVMNDPDNSILVWKLEGTDAAGRQVFGDGMPLGRAPLSDVDIARIRTWIAEGGLNSSAPPSPPRILSATVIDSNSIEVTFDSEVDGSSAAGIAHYQIVGEHATAVLVVVGAARETTDRVILDTQTLAPGVIYTVSIVGLRGANGLVISDIEAVQIRFLPNIGFAGQIQPVFDQSCAFVGCHAADDRFPPGAGLVLSAGSARQNLVDIPSIQQTGARHIVSGNSDDSYLVNKLSGVGIAGDQMPVGGPFLSPAEIQVFRLWIEQGAEDN
jgi:hypothetical protein